MSAYQLLESRIGGVEVSLGPLFERLNRLEDRPLSVAFEHEQTRCAQRVHAGHDLGEREREPLTEQLIRAAALQEDGEPEDVAL